MQSEQDIGGLKRCFPSSKGAFWNFLALIRDASYIHQKWYLINLIFKIIHDEDNGNKMLFIIKNKKKPGSRPSDEI